MRQRSLPNRQNFVSTLVVPLVVSLLAKHLKAFELPIEVHSQQCSAVELRTLCALADANIEIGQLGAAATNVNDARRLLQAQGSGCHLCQSVLLTSESKLEAENGNYAEASRLLVSALSCIPADSFIEVADAKCRLATAELRQRHMARSKELLQEAEDAIRDRLGQTHPLYVRWLEGMAEVAMIQGEFPIAHKYVVAAAELCDISPKSTHPEKADVLMLAAGLYWAAEKLEDAENTYSDACNAYRASGAEMRLAKALNARAITCCALGKLEDCRKYIKESQDTIKVLGISHHPLRAKNVYDASKLAMQCKEYGAALKGLRYASSEFAFFFGDRDPRSTLVRVDIGVCQAELGDFRGSMETLRAAISTMESRKWNDLPEYGVARRTLDFASKKQEELAKGNL